MQFRWISRIGGSIVFRVLLVLLIAAMLAFVFSPKIRSHQPYLLRSRAIADIAALGQALDSFKRDTGRYPTTEEGLQALVNPPGSLAAVTNSKIDGVPLDPWHRPYVYRSPGQKGKGFELFCTGPSGEEGNADNICAE